MEPDAHRDHSNLRGLSDRRGYCADLFWGNLRLHWAPCDDASWAKRFVTRSPQLRRRTECVLAVRGASADGSRCGTIRRSVDCCDGGIQLARPVEARGLDHDRGPSRGVHNCVASWGRADSVRATTDSSKLLGVIWRSRGPIRCNVDDAASERQQDVGPLAVQDPLHTAEAAQSIRSLRGRRDDGVHTVC